MMSLQAELARYADMPRDPVNDRPGMDPTYLPEYKGPTLLTYLKSEKASEEFKAYCRACVSWHKHTDCKHERPPWLRRLLSSMGIRH